MTEESQFHPSLPSFQFAWDNTSLSMLKDCPRKYKYAIIDGWRANGKAAPLVFGGAWHDCVELFDKTIASGYSVQVALHFSIRKAFALSAGWDLGDTARTRASLVRGLVWYSEEYHNDSLKLHMLEEGKPALEVSFRFDLPFNSPSGIPLLYCGHMDKMVEYNGGLYTVERKSTKSALNQNFFQRYFFSSQVTGYVYAGNVVFHQPISGAIIEASSFGVNYVRYGRAVVHRVLDHLEEWATDLQYWVALAERYATDNYWPHNTESCSKYSGCQFRGVCSKSPNIRDTVLNLEFHKEPWNPLRNRGED